MLQNVDKKRTDTHGVCVSRFVRNNILTSVNIIKISMQIFQEKCNVLNSQLTKGGGCVLKWG